MRRFSSTIQTLGSTRFVSRSSGLLLVCWLVLSGSTAGQAAEAIDYTERDDVIQFVDMLVSEHGFDRTELLDSFAQSRYQPKIIAAITRPAEKRLKWWEYRKIFLTEKRIRQGAEFWIEHEKTLEKIARKYKVDPEIIVAILGVETFYGQRAGSHRVMDALTTLGFDYPPRARFFRSQLEQFLLLVREEKRDPFTFKGSYAGAMGYGQFIPSSYRSFAVDFDQDGLRDIWTNVQDATASVANYLARHHWKYRQPVVYPVTVQGDAFEGLVNQGLRTQGIKKGALVSEFRRLGVSTDLPDGLKLGLIRLEDRDGFKYWLADHNFFVVTTYNISRLYAMAVYDLSQAVVKDYCAALSARKRRSVKQCS